MLVECSSALENSFCFIGRSVRICLFGRNEVQHIYNNTEAMSLLAVRLRMRPLYNLVFCFPLLVS